MNIYWFELKAQLKSFIIWTLVILFFFVVFMSGIYPVFYDSLDDVLALLEGFPPAFAAAFGLHITDMFSFEGFFSFTFGYLALVGGIMAVSVALSAFAREKRSKCTDFLLTKPVNRGGIFLAKLLSGLTVLTATNLLFMLTAASVYKAGNQDEALSGSFILAAAGLFFTQLVFFAVGVLYATLVKKVRSVSGIATAFGFAGFILSALVGFLEEEALRYVAPLKYFDPAAVFSTGGYEAKYAVTAVMVTVICMIVSYIKYCRSDAHAV